MKKLLITNEFKSIIMTKSIKVIKQVIALVNGVVPTLSNKEIKQYLSTFNGLNVNTISGVCLLEYGDTLLYDDRTFIIIKDNKTKLIFTQIVKGVK